LKLFALFVSCLALLASAACARSDDDAIGRSRMVAEVRALARTMEGAGTRISSEVYDALARVPRHAFVPANLRARAYQNTPLPIGHGQTISQPYIVAVMTELAGAGPGVRILEIGTGSGYQAAMLAEMGAEVFSIEIIPALGARAAKDLAEAGYSQVQTRIGDGYAGWPDAAPFDAILVTAAPDHVPAPLTAQLKSGGRMVIPVGTDGGLQHLLLLIKRPDGTLEQQKILPVRFVPLTR